MVTSSCSLGWPITGTDEREHVGVDVTGGHSSGCVCEKESPLPAELLERCRISCKVWKVLGEDLGRDIRHKAPVPFPDGPRVVGGMILNTLQSEAALGSGIHRIYHDCG